MTDTINKRYSLHTRLSEIDPYFRRDQLMTVIGTGRLKRVDDMKYGFYEPNGTGEPFFVLTKEFVEERGNFGDDMLCFMVEYVANDGKRRLETVTMPIEDSGEGGRE